MSSAINNFFQKRSVFSVAVLTMILVLIEASFSFCSGHDCPAFTNADFDKWFPYKTGDTLCFLSDRNNRDTFSGLGVEKSEPYRTSGGFEQKDCNSATVYIYSSASSDRLIVSASQSHSFIDEVRLAINNFSVTAYNIGDSGLGLRYGDIKHATYYGSYIFNNVSYSGIQIIEADTASTKFNGIYKIWLAKNKGVVGYETYPTLERWAKQ